MSRTLGELVSKYHKGSSCGCRSRGCGCDSSSNLRSATGEVGYGDAVVPEVISGAASRMIVARISQLESRRTPGSVGEVEARRILAASTMVREAHAQAGAKSLDSLLSRSGQPLQLLDRIVWTARFEYHLTRMLVEAGLNLASYDGEDILSAFDRAIPSRTPRAARRTADDKSAPDYRGSSPVYAAQSSARWNGGSYPTAQMGFGVRHRISTERPQPRTPSVERSRLTSTRLPISSALAQDRAERNEIREGRRSGDSAAKSPPVAAPCSSRRAGRGLGPFGGCGLLPLSGPAGAGPDPDPRFALSSGITDPFPGGQVEEPPWIDPSSPCYGLDPEQILDLISSPPPLPLEGKWTKKTLKEFYVQHTRVALNQEAKELKDHTDQVTKDINDVNKKIDELEKKGDTKSSEHSKLLLMLFELGLELAQLEKETKQNAQKTEEVEKRIKKLEKDIEDGKGNDPPDPDDLGPGSDFDPEGDRLAACRNWLLDQYASCMLAEGDSRGDRVSCAPSSLRPIDCDPNDDRCQSIFCGCESSDGSTRCAEALRGLVGTSGTEKLEVCGPTPGESDRPKKAPCPPECAWIASGGGNESDLDCSKCMTSSGRGDKTFVEICSARLPPEIFAALGCGYIDPVPLLGGNMASYDRIGDITPMPARSRRTSMVSPRKVGLRPRSVSSGGVHLS